MWSIKTFTYFKTHPLDKRRWLISSSSLPWKSRNLRTWVVFLKATTINFIRHGRYHIYSLRNKIIVIFSTSNTFYPLFKGIYKRKEALCTLLLIKILTLKIVKYSKNLNSKNLNETKTSCYQLFVRSLMHFITNKFPYQ